MYYGKRRSPEWGRQAVLLALLVVIAIVGWHSYQLVRPDVIVEENDSPPIEEALPEPEPHMRTEDELVVVELPDPTSPYDHVVEELLPEPPPSKPPLATGAEEPWLHVVKGRMRLYYYRGDRLEREYPIAIGANGGQKRRVGDNRTPVGSFSVQQIQDSRKWTYDFGDGNGPIRGAYGPWFIRLRTPGWKGIGIHGTHDPDSIGTMVTQGCVRLLNEDLQELKEKVFVGMAVLITER